MASLFSDIVSNDTSWGNPDADYHPLLGVVGGAAGSNRAVVKASLVANAVNTPVGCLFTLDSDIDYRHY